ncbi:MAG: trigger factor, partial [Chloroflexi bacterium]|nr:trigger factor [Chloroflexota bacterium]
TEEALKVLVDEIYPQAIEEAGIEAAGSGKLEKVDELDPPTFEFIIPLKPEIDLGDYKSINFPYEPPETSDVDVDEVIKNIQKQRALLKPVKRPAEEGDIVFINIGGRRTDIEDENNAALFEDRFSSAVIQTQETDEWPCPGFSQQLIGLSAEDEKNISYTYPEDYDDEELRGVEAAFHVVVTNIQSRSLPKLDDKFAKTAAGIDTIKELRANIKVNLILQALADYNTTYNETILNQLIEESVIKYPQQILENEKDDFTNRFEGQLAEQGNSMNLYMQTRGIDEETLDKEITLAAETQLKQKLVLIELAEVEDLQIDLEQLDAKLKGTISVATKNLSSKDAKKYTTKEFVSALSARITEEMLIEKAAEYLRAITKGELIPEESGEPEDAGGEAQPEDDTQPEETSQESVSTSETEVIVLEGENPPESKVNP